MDIELKTMDLSFCGQVAHNIVNKDAKEFILKQLKTKYSIGINDNRAYILHDKSVYFLEKTQHIISIKSSGTNYLLFFTRINNTNYCFYIDRKISPGYTIPRIISTKYGFSDSIFNDTLLDGELVKNDKNQWMFLITDILVHEGTLLKTNIISRFNLLYSMLTNSYNIDKDFDICPLVVKRLFKYSEYDYLITQFIPSLSYKTKGLYFNTLNTKHGNQLFIFPNDRNNNKMSYSQKKSLDTGNPSNLNNMEQANQHGRYNGNSNNTNNTYTNTGNTISELDSDSDSNKQNNSGLIFKIDKTSTPEIYNLYYSDNHDIVKLDRPAYVNGLRKSKLISRTLGDSQSGYMFCSFNSKQRMWEPMTKADISGDNYLSSKQKIDSIESAVTSQSS